MMSSRIPAPIDPEAWLPPLAPLEMRRQVLDDAPRPVPQLVAPVRPSDA